VGRLAPPTPPSEFCQACRKQREEKKLALRKLVVIHESATQSEEFDKPEIPLRLCPTCDGPELEAAMALHGKATPPTE